MIIALLRGLLKCKVSIMACKFSKSRMVGEWRGLQEKEGSDFYSFFWLSKCIFEKKTNGPLCDFKFKKWGFL